MDAVDPGNLTKAFLQPEGCVGIEGVRAEGESRRLLRQIVGRHVFELDFTGDALRLVHATPGGGTWVATLPLTDVPGRESLSIVLAWAPAELRLSAVDPDDRTKGVVAVGERSDRRLQVDSEGGATILGPDAFGVTVYSNGAKVSTPPAIELWDQTLRAVRILLTGTSSEGFMYEVVTCNAALSMLVTGLETYCQERFIELEGEGLPVESVEFLKRFGLPHERAEIKAGQEADVRGAAQLAQRVNFQNFDDIKRAFAKAYGLRMGVHVDASNQVLDRVRTLIRYRHRIVHVSPMTTIPNMGPDVSADDWEWSGKALAESASEDIDTFVQALHQATLALRPSRPQDATP
jgi:hypothetical protein